MARKFIDMIPRIDKLQRDKRDFPVPYFVEWLDGEPDFRIMNPEKFAKCINHNICWVCGEQMGKFKAFVAGPMCGINRTSAEPPSHKDCAIFSAQNCPFLTKPKLQRNEKGFESMGACPVGGDMIKRNPGLAMVWITKSYKPYKDHNGGILIEMGDPVEVLWFKQSRPATRSEVIESIDSGIHLLENVAREHDEMDAFNQARDQFMQYLPKEKP